jgi:C1A family cysteine protease
MKTNFYLCFAIVLLTFASCLKEDQNPFEQTIEMEESTETPTWGGLQLMDREEYVKLPVVDVSQLAPITNDYLETRSTKVQLNTPPVWSQGTEGSCASFSIGYVALSYYLKMIKGMPYSSTGAYRSPEFLYNNSKMAGDCTQGSNMTTVLNYVKNSGACSWSEMPYSDKNGCSNKGTTTQKNQAKAGKIKSWTRITNNVNNLRNLLKLGYPIIIGLHIDTNFDKQVRNYPYTYYSKGSLTNTGHAMVIVGYDDATQRFILQNSWGKDKHDRGFLYITYNLMPTLNTELFYIDPAK